MPVQTLYFMTTGQCLGGSYRWPRGRPGRSTALTSAFDLSAGVDEEDTLTDTASRPIAEVDATVFRHVVGHLASGVTVITTTDSYGDHGMTASSVTSLSLEPPMMLICLNRAAPTSAAVSRAGAYAVNVLGLGHESLAQQFAAPSKDKFRGVSLSRGRLGLPILDDALAHIECRVVEEVTGGTHTIFLGQVARATAREGQPLTYFRGGFGRFEFARDDAAYQRARQLVLDGMLAPGVVIEVDDLARQLDVDASSAFYALTRLAADGLVRRDPDRGYEVAAFDVRAADDAFDARCVIELGVIEMTIGRVSESELKTLRERFEAMSRLLVGDRFVDFDGYIQANYAFHECVVNLAHNPSLTAAFARLSLKGVMARSFGSTPVTSQRFIDVQRRLTEAFERGDKAAAREAVKEYNVLAKRRVREILSDNAGLRGVGDPTAASAAR
jgi:flavin reductase (DIM6/NTAB) family NADH-FMN oxidoreductase RutF/DNA-binding GntR family transcriptional regulator